jgi:diaminohydroxyphosphoribosylaminopyrimidine deaminase / 5-amino-6-(5-phosphoribosylamino)uracil reductase
MLIACSASTHSQTAKAYSLRQARAGAIFCDLSSAAFPALENGISSPLPHLVEGYGATMSGAFTEQDRHYMALALSLAERAKGATAPNPAVGAVVVNDGKLVGQGMTAACGGPHAERRALAQARSAARGATMYVTLEPCCHFGRTSPCTDAIIEAGVVRVVASLRDPFPAVRGKGLARLRRAGISTGVGLLRAEAARLNEEFLWWSVHRAPWVSLKLAMTLDGRIADTRGTSRWITSKDSRVYVHRLRLRHMAIAVGRGTLVADNPSLTVRHVRGGSPVRFVFSTSGRVPTASTFVKTAREVRSIVVAGGDKPLKRIRPSGVEVWWTGERKPADMLHRFLAMAYEDGIQSVLFEGGQGLAASLLEEQLVNRLYLFYGNKILGSGLDGIRLRSARALGEAITLDRCECHRFGNDMMTTGLVRRST